MKPGDVLEVYAGKVTFFPLGGSWGDRTFLGVSDLMLAISNDPSTGWLLVLCRGKLGRVQRAQVVRVL